MKAVIGLGNPDAKYKNTRHNIGFMVLDRILGRKNLKLSDKFSGFFAKSEDVLFLLPLTYMNLSGRAVVELMNFYKLAPEDIIVVFDDASLPLGTLRFRVNGSDGGHNGIKSIINSIGSSDFKRLKVGIGEQPPNMPLENYVLANFSKEETPALDKVLDIAADSIEDYLKDIDIVTLQSNYNKSHV
jgi:PTH1 family peptidyl-tRNA hydrolase